MLFFLQHWEQSFQIIFSWSRSILTNFESFRMLNLSSIFFAIPLFKSGSYFRGDSNGTIRSQPGLTLRNFFGNFIEISADPGQPFIHLRFMRIQCVYFLSEDSRDIYGDIRSECIRSLKEILKI